MGSDNAAYVVLVYPIVALLLLTCLEGYQWQVEPVIGVFVVLVGNAVVMGKLTRRIPQQG